MATKAADDAAKAVEEKAQAIADAAKAATASGAGDRPPIGRGDDGRRGGEGV